MPCSFIPAITMSIIPAITMSITLMDHKAVCATEESAARITGLIALPCAVGLFVLAEPVTALIGGYEGESLVLAGRLMALMGIGVFFYSIVQLTNAVMQAHGHASIPVVNMLLAGVMRLIIVYILTGNSGIQLLGAPIGAALCYLAIGVMNLIAMAKVIPEKPAIAKNLLRPLIPSAVMGVAAFGAWFGLSKFTDSRLLLCAIPVMVGVAVYAVLVIKFKAITRDDCLLLPKGEKIADLLHL
jgi:stage V sporulation protein B